MLQGRNAANQATDRCVWTWCCGAQSASELCELSGPTFGFPMQELVWWAVTRRTLKTTKLSKVGGWALARVWALAGDNTVKHDKSPTALTNCCYRRTQTIPQWFSSTQMLMLSAVGHFIRITFIVSTPSEAQLSMCLHTAYRDKMKTTTAKVRWDNAKPNKGMCACFQEKYILCIYC